jgi:release factor glutamine methyltransferase
MELYAADIDPAAVRCARRNVPGAVLQGDLFEPVPDQVRGGVDILLANVPYVPAAAIASLPPEAREHEPRAALDGGTDGLDVLRRVSAGAADWLAPGGHVLSETGTAQASMGAAILTGDGLAGEVVHDAESGATIVVGTRSS